MKNRILHRLLPISIFFLLWMTNGFGQTTYRLINSTQIAPGSPTYRGWEDPANWFEGRRPPTPLPAGDIIYIEPTTNQIELVTFYTFYGTIVVGSGKTLTFYNQDITTPESPRIFNQGTIINNGTLLTIGDLQNSGTIQNNSVFKIVGSGSLNNVGTINNGTTTNTAATLLISETPSSGGCAYLVGLLNKNLGTVNNYGTMQNNMTLQNLVGSAINNFGTLTKGNVCNTSNTVNTGTITIQSNSLVSLPDGIDNTGGTLNINSGGRYLIRNTANPGWLNSLVIGTLNWNPGGIVELGSSFRLGGGSVNGVPYLAALTVPTGAILKIGSTGTLTVASGANINLFGDLRIETGGVLNNSGFIAVANNGTAHTLTNNGIINNNSILDINISTMTNGGTINNFSGASLGLNSSTLTNNGAINIGGTLDNISTIVNNNNITISGTLNNNGGIIRNNATITNNGTFYNNAILGGTNAQYVLNTPATLGPNGSVEPGASPGLLTVTGSLDMSAAKYVCEINGTANTDYDRFAITDNVNISGARLDVVWGFTPLIGSSYTILTCGSRTGDFATVNIPQIAGLILTLDASNPTSIVIRVTENIPTSQSVGSGPWHLSSTWANGNIPTATSAVVINSGHTVDVTTVQTCRSVSVIGGLNIQGGGKLSVSIDNVAALGNNREVNVSGTLNVEGNLNVGGKVVVAATGVLTMNGGTIAINGKNTTSQNSITGELFEVKSGAIFTANSGTIKLYPPFSYTQNLMNAPFPFYNAATVGTTCTGVTVKIVSSGSEIFQLTGSNEMELFNLDLDNANDGATYYFRAVKVKNGLTSTSTSGGQIYALAEIINSVEVSSSFGFINLTDNYWLNGSINLIKPLTNCVSNSYINVGNISYANLNIIDVGRPNNVLVNNYVNGISFNSLNLAGGTIKFGTTIGAPDVQIANIYNGNEQRHIKKGTSKILVDLVEPQDVPLMHENSAGVENYAPIRLIFASPFPIQGGAYVGVGTTSVTDIPATKAAIKHAWTIEAGFANPTTVTFSWKADAEVNPAFSANRSSCQIYRKDGTTWIPIPVVGEPIYSLNGIYYKQITVPSGLPRTAPFEFTIMTDVPPMPIISAQDGDWNVGSTWVGGVIPTATDDVVIAHAVTNPSSNATTTVCKNLTINATKTLTQSSQLQINGDVVVNGTFFQDFDPNPANFTRVGNVTAAGTNLVTVSGTMTLTGASNAFTLAGRIVFNTGSTLNLNTVFNFSGWSGGTPQYLMDIDNLTNLTYNYMSTQPSFSVIGNLTGNTKQIISPNGNIAMTCYPVWQGVAINQTNATRNNYYFGDAASAQQEIDHVNASTSSTTVRNLNLNNVFTKLTANYTNVYSTNGQYSVINATNSTLYGEYTLKNSTCSVPYLTFNSGTSVDNSFIINVNATDSAIINIASGNNQNILGTFNAQNGKIIVKGGTLDLRSPLLTLTGLSTTRYFETKMGTELYSAMGAVLLPAVGTAPVNFNLGLTIPNASGTPTSIYAPVNIVSNNGNSNISVSLRPLTLPTGFTAPLIQWDITPSGSSPSLTMTFTWPLSAETYAFAISRVNARVYHWNGAIWEELVSEPAIVDVANQTVSMRVQNVTNFSPFMVAVLNTALSAELIDFKAKINGNNAQLTWQTASEINVKNFDIEKSLDGKKFEKFASRDAMHRVSTPKDPSVYQAFDDQFSTSAYYRLKINELDGRSNYSKIIYLEKNTEKSIKIRRDTEGSLWVETDDKIELILVTNTIGQVVKSSKDKQLLINDLNAGIYLISVKTDKGFLSQKFFKE